MDHISRADVQELEATPMTKSWQSYHNNRQFCTDITSLQASKQIKPGDDISPSINAIKYFLSKVGERYTLHMKSITLSDISKLHNFTVNEVMKTITFTHDGHRDRAEPLHETGNEEVPLSLFNQHSDLMAPSSDWLATEDAVTINKVSRECISTTYHVTVQQCITTELFNTGANMSVILQNFVDSLPQKMKLLTSNTWTVMSASGTYLGLIGQCYLTFQLEKKHFREKFIILWDLQRDLIWGINWKFNYKIEFNWSINGHQYIADNTYFCTSIPLTIINPIVQNAGAFYLQPRGILKIIVQAPTELKPQYIYKLSASDDLPSDLVTLAFDCKINNKYPSY